MAYRPSHADATYDAKYGIRAIAGGGRSSARETIGRVAAAAVARKVRGRRRRSEGTGGGVEEGGQGRRGRGVRVVVEGCTPWFFLTFCSAWF